MSISPQEVLDYWYSDRIKPSWFNSTAALDAEIRDKFSAVWEVARAGGLDHWQGTAEGCLALVIILDQLPLNMYRGQPQSFATEAKAVEVCLQAVEQGFDKRIEKNRLAFLYMPLMHSENLQHQQRSVELFEAAGLEENARFARHHRQIVEKFGRFPHRNDILGRPSSPAEIDYLNSSEAFRG